MEYREKAADIKSNNAEVYRRFDDPVEANQWAQENFASIIARSSDDEVNALMGYKMSTFDAINRSLRDSDYVIPAGERVQFSNVRSGGLEMRPVSKEEFEKLNLQQLDNVMSRSSVPEPIVCFRAMESKMLSLPREQLIGLEVADDAFQSASLTETFPLKWAQRIQAEKGQSAILEIRVPAGKPCVAFEPVLQETQGRSDRQQELLLGRGQKWRIIDVIEEAGVPMRLVVELQ